MKHPFPPALSLEEIRNKKNWNTMYCIHKIHNCVFAIIIYIENLAKNVSV